MVLRLERVELTYIAEIRKEMVVRQRAHDHCNENNIEIPPVLRTAYKPINAKGQRILENGTLETAKQERVRARMDLAEFNTQMRILRKQAKDAAIHAGLQKHAELTGKISSTEPPVKQEAQNSEQDDRPADVMSALEDSLPSAPPGAARIGMKRSRPESENATSSLEHSDLNPGAPSQHISDLESSTLTDEIRASRRQKLQNDGAKANNKQGGSINSDRQAMIDAQLALSANKKRRKLAQLTTSSSLLREADANGERKFGRNSIGKGANSWNLDGLPSDRSRKSKFQRLLGGQKSTIEGGDGPQADDPARSTQYSGHINANLERQYASEFVYKKESKRKGLGA